MLAERQEHRPRCAFAHGRHPVTAGVLAQQAKHVAILGVGGQLGVHHRAALPQVRHKAPQPLQHHPLAQPLRAELLVELRRQPSGHLLQQRQRQAQHGHPHPIERAATVAEVAELGVGLPQETLEHTAGQPAATRHGALLQQPMHPVALPGHVGADELGNKLVAGHVQRAITLGALALQRGQEPRPRQRRHASRPNLVTKGLGQGRAHVVQVGAGAKKSRPVGRVLHRVRERNQLLVVVERAGPAVLHHLRSQRGIAGTQQHQPVTRAAGGATAVMAGELGIALREAAPARGPEHGQQLMVSTGLARPAAVLQLAAGGTHGLHHAVGLRP